MTTAPTAVGRPRDPAVDERVAAAAVAVFGEVGWSGFSIEAVARRAGVGKASIYLRWPTKEELLAAALKLRMAAIDEIDTGSARGDLVDLTRQMVRLYLGNGGQAFQRLTLDGAQVPQIREQYDAMTRAQVLAARAIVHRGIHRGELPGSTSVTLLLDALCGGAMVHAISTPADLRAEVAAQAEAYAERLVDFLLGSALSVAD